MAKSIRVEILGDASQFAAELDKAAGRARRFAEVAKVAGVALSGALAVGLGLSVKAALEGQASQAALDAALRATHQSVEAMTPALEGAQAAARDLGFGNDEARAALSRLEVATGDTTKAVSDLGVAENIARLKHIDLASASQTLAQAMTGSQRAAKQLGITVSPVTTNLDALKASHVNLTSASGKLQEAHAKLLDKMATGQSVIAAVTDKVSGQAQAYAATAAGGMAQFHAQTQNLEEALGNMLLPALTLVADKMADLADFFSKHKTLAKGLVIGLGAIAASLTAVSVASGIASAAAGIATVATGAWAAANWALTAALDANPIVIVAAAIIGAVAAIGVAIYELVTHWSAAWHTMEAAVSAVSGFVTKTVPAAFQSVLGWVRSRWPEIATIISGPFAPLVALATGAFGIRSALEEAFTGIERFITSSLAGIGKLGEAILKAPVNAAINMIDSIHIPGFHVHLPIVGDIGWGGLTPFNIPQLAAGGIVTSPTLALIGEAGPEAVVPLGRGGFGGGDTYNFTFSNYVGDRNELMQTVVEGLRRYNRSGSL